MGKESIMPNAKEYTVDYFATLKVLLSNIEVSDRNGALSFEEGMDETVNLIQGLKARGNKIMLIGNGASAAIASHQAADFLRAAGIRASAFNDAPILTCLGNDLGYEHTFDYSIGLMAKPDDILICISSSGASMNILNGADRARGIGCNIITLSGFEPTNPLRRLGDVNFYVASDSYGKVEVIHLAVLHCINDYLAGR